MLAGIYKNCSLILYSAPKKVSFPEILVSIIYNIPLFGDFHQRI